MTTQPFDALLVLSFGGPEGEDEVLPFLENVTRGRGIPRERLKVVGEHYYRFGGVSPLNKLNLEIIDHVRTIMAAGNGSLPIYFGNRNWHPFAEEAAENMARDGVHNALVFATSAWGGYSGCLQYDEDIRRIRKHLTAQGLAPIEFTKLRQFFDHPLFIQEVATQLQETLALFDVSEHPRVIFTAHSVPLVADRAAGGEEDSQLYSRQVHEAANLVAARLGISDYDVVWQSRSGSPAMPWLGPDVVEHVTMLHDTSDTRAIAVCPIGFISDHMEVIWDLDTELRATATELGFHMERTPTIGPSVNFAHLVVELIDELRYNRPARKLSAVTTEGCTVNGEACRPGCCSIQRPNSRTA